MKREKVMVLAGMFARSNMGQNRADDAAVTRAKQNPPKSASAAAIFFCEPFMETDEHEDIFTEEVKMWMHELTKMTDEQLAKDHPDLAAQYDRA